MQEMEQLDQPRTGEQGLYLSEEQEETDPGSCDGTIVNIPTDGSGCTSWCNISGPWEIWAICLVPTDEGLWFIEERLWQAQDDYLTIQVNT